MKGAFTTRLRRVRDGNLNPEAQKNLGKPLENFQKIPIGS
jgi:hypothetical protein